MLRLVVKCCTGDAMKRVVSVFLLLAVLSSIQASGVKEETPSCRIGAVMPDSSAVFWQGVWKGAERGAAENNASLSEYSYSVASEGEMEMQLDKVILSKVDGILLSASSLSERSRELLSEAKAEGIRVVLCDSASFDAEYDTLVGLDNRASGERMAEELSARGFSEVVILDANAGSRSTATQSRLRALERGLDGSGVAYTAVSFQSAGFEGTGLLQEIIAEHADGACFVCLNSHLTLLTAQAVEYLSLGGSTFVAGWCEEPEAFNYVGEGIVDLLAIQDVYELGRLSAEVLCSLIAGAEAEPVRHIQVSIVTADNIDEYWDGEKRL